MSLLKKNIDKLVKLSTFLNQFVEGESFLLYKNFLCNLSSPAGIVSSEGEFIFINDSFVEFFSLTKMEITKEKNKDFLNIATNKNRSAYKKKFNVGNEIKTLKIRNIPLEIENKFKGLGFIIEDISYNEKYQQKLLKEINIDSLTGLYSKKYLKKSIKKHIANSKSFTLLHLDFDKFKLINDGLGEVVGDKVLQIIANKIYNFFGEYNTVISRLGSDEFGVLIAKPNNLEETSKLVQKLINEIGKSIFVGNNEIFVSLSAGIIDSQIINGVGTPDEYLRDAEIALHKAKSYGRGKFKVFDKKMYYSIIEQCNLELALQKAYKNNEFEVFYQPIYSTTKNQIVSLETLIRWEHKRLGFVAPDKFISSAEDLGLIRDLDRDTVETSLKKLKEINKTYGTNISISINISAIEFSSNAITKFIKNIIKKTKIKPNLINLEITESVLLSDLQGARKTMNELKDVGVKITLDDFGTGFASLSYLRKLPIDTIKIDKSFINEITSDKSAVAITKMLIELGKELNLNIITEGVETKKQFDILSQLGCENFQGYYLAKPIRGKLLDSYLSKVLNIN